NMCWCVCMCVSVCLYVCEWVSVYGGRERRQKGPCRISHNYHSPLNSWPCICTLQPFQNAHTHTHTHTHIHIHTPPNLSHQPTPPPLPSSQKATMPPFFYTLSLFLFLSVTSTADGPPLPPLPP